MVCLYCRSETRVINSRRQKKTNQTWRRRQCLSCFSIFTTLERTLLEQSLVVEDKATLQPFERDKLFISIYKSCGHRSKAVEEAKFLTETVITKLLATSVKAIIDKKTLADTVSSVLKRFDKPAAVYYQAFHPS